jgi:rubredoxin
VSKEFHRSTIPPVKTEVEWEYRLGAPAAWKCPECESDIWPGYDEDAGGNIRSDGTWYCSTCGYFYEESKPDDEEM